ncbi:MAG: hypothetical protein ACXAB4_10145 [Candidatus Hodarchaeales archaeon]|jgi:hypothetical protein
MKDIPHWFLPLLIIELLAYELLKGSNPTIHSFGLAVIGFILIIAFITLLAELYFDLQASAKSRRYHWFLSDFRYQE